MTLFILIALIALASSELLAQAVDQHNTTGPPTHRIDKGKHYNLCTTVYAAKTFRHFSKKNKENETLVYGDEVSKINSALQKHHLKLPVFAAETDIRRTEWIHTFSLYCGYTYCDSQTKVTKMARPLQGLTVPLPTGNFKILDWVEHQGYIGGRRLASQLDGFFYTTVNPGQKLITMTWRGSDKANDFIADADRGLLGFEDDMSRIYANNPTQNPNCSIPTNTTDVFFFGGYIKTIQRRVLDMVVVSLRKARHAYPHYSIVMNGHSLGAAKAILVAAYLAKFHYRDLPLAAVYTFGQPIVGSTKAGDWIAQCIGPQKIVRVTASDDLVPWVRFADNVQHPSSVVEMYNPNSKSDVWVRCQGSLDPACSYGIQCSLRNWAHHSFYGGFKMGFDLCRSLPDDTKPDQIVGRN
jgi:hypothetical protein